MMEYFQLYNKYHHFKWLLNEKNKRTNQGFLYLL